MLENTIGNIWFDYKDVGGYGIISNDLFTNLKSTAILGTPYEVGDVSKPGLYATEFFSENTLKLFTFTVDRTLADNFLDLTFIEIRVYN